MIGVAGECVRTFGVCQQEGTETGNGIGVRE